MSWRRPNRSLYRLYYSAQHLGTQRLAEAARADLRPPRRTSTGPKPVLYVTWGRIGDTALGTAASRQLGEWFDRPVVMLGRPEVADLVRDHVDRFIPFDPDRWATDEWYRRNFASAVEDEYELIIGDVHLFHGGGFMLNQLIDWLPAEQKFVYEGYADTSLLAPNRPWPKTATLIPALRKEPANVASRHVWHDIVHYFSEILVRTNTSGNVSAEAMPRISLSGAPAATDLLEHFDLGGSYIACQPWSQNPKKDVTAETWDRVFRAHSDTVFVLLGSQRDAPRSKQFRHANVVDLSGQTTLLETTRIIDEAKLFVGPDSGLTHIATCLGLETVCVSQSANLGYFFPYPPQLTQQNLQVVQNAKYDHCAGCMSICSEEPIWKTHELGAKCVRTIDPETVVEAVRAGLARSAERDLTLHRVAT